jgi:carboxymethylenebutenolidase
MTDRGKITQEMIDLYDEYTHITLDRRAYLGRMTALLGSTAAAVAATSLIEADQAAAQIVPANDPRVKAERLITFNPGTGQEMAGYLARPADATGRLPAVVVIHENRGLVSHIEDVTRRMALEGFLALAPDFLHQSGGTPTDEDQGRAMIGKLDQALTVANAVASLRFLKAYAGSNGKVGATGFCWGGRQTNALAVAAGEDLLAAVPYYGAQPPAGDVPRIKARLLLHYAQNDDNINRGIPAYREALDKAGIRYELFIYDGTQHAFNNDTSAARYNKPAADLAWSRTVALFKEALA